MVLCYESTFPEKRLSVVPPIPTRNKLDEIQLLALVEHLPSIACNGCGRDISSLRFLSGV